MDERISPAGQDPANELMQRLAALQAETQAVAEQLMVDAEQRLRRARDAEAQALAVLQATRDEADAIRSTLDAERDGYLEQVRTSMAEERLRLVAGAEEEAERTRVAAAEQAEAWLKEAAEDAELVVSEAEERRDRFLANAASEIELWMAKVTSEYAQLEADAKERVRRLRDAAADAERTVTGAKQRQDAPDAEAAPLGPV